MHRIYTYKHMNADVILFTVKVQTNSCTYRDPKNQQGHTRTRYKILSINSNG